MHTKTLSWGVRLLLAALLIAALVSVVRGQEIITSRGVICDTPDQVKAFLDNPSIVDINERFGKNACIVAPVAYLKGAEWERYRKDGQTYAIYSIAALALFTSQGWQPLDQLMPWFIPISIKEDGA